MSGILSPSPTITILLDNESLRPGDKVKGKIRLECRRPIPMSEMKVSLRGKRTIKPFLTYRTKKFLKKDCTLWTSDNGHRNEIPPGTHFYSFSFTIPKHLFVPSFRGAIGNVKYYIKVTPKFDIHSTTKIYKEFTVKFGNEPVVKHNRTEPNAPVEQLKEMVKVTTTVSDNVIHPGMLLNVSAHLQNQSSTKTIRKIRFKLVQETNYHVCHKDCVKMEKSCNVQEQRTLAKTVMEDYLVPCSQHIHIVHMFTVPSELYCTFSDGMISNGFKVMVELYTGRAFDGKPLVFEHKLKALDSAPIDGSVMVL
ncbi:unnamed protein product [Caenorhabditis brenneri]